LVQVYLQSVGRELESQMITPEGKLQVFEDFVIDRALPKFQKKTKSRHAIMIQKSTFESMSDDEVDGEDIQSFSGNIMVTPSRRIHGVEQGQNPILSLWTRMMIVVFGWFGKRPKQLPPVEPVPTLTVQEFFVSVKNTEQELEIVKGRAEGYAQAIDNAKKAGQRALVEQLTSGMNAARMEVQLLAIGLAKYLREEDVIRFYKLCPKGLRLDWVQNFARMIPAALIDLKGRADAIGIFDNYVVLHYDPKAKSYAETEKEKAARKDPILFGLMKNRRLLYVVGDWVDEFCDLTLDQVADTIGRDAIQTVAPLTPYRT
jgi:hypothetical protein